MIMETKPNQGPAYLMLGPDEIRFIGGAKPFFEPACIAYDNTTRKPVAIGTHAEDVARNGRPVLCTALWPLRHENVAEPGIIGDLVDRFSRKIFFTVGNRAHEVIVTLPKDCLSEEVMRAVHPVVRNVFGCKVRFGELKDPDTGPAAGIVVHEFPGTGSVSKVTAAADCTGIAGRQKDSDMKSIIKDLLRIMVPLTVVCFLIGVWSHDFLIIGGWAMCLEMTAIFCLKRQTRALRKKHQDSAGMGFWSTRNLVAAVICTLAIAAVIAALKYFWGITFVVRGILLGLPFTILVCEWFQYRALLDRAADESCGSRDE